MPYINKGNPGLDKNGVKIKVWDVLEATDNGPWRYFLAEPGWEGEGMEIRCFNAHNVGMAELDQLETLGNYKNHIGTLVDDDMLRGIKELIKHHRRGHLYRLFEKMEQEK